MYNTDWGRLIKTHSTVALNCYLIEGGVKILEIIVNLFIFNSRLENGWYVREVPSPVQTGGTSSTVPSTPPSDGEHEILTLNGGIPEPNSNEKHVETSKQTKKVCLLKTF